MLALPVTVRAQMPLDRVISFEVHQIPLAQVLDSLSGREFRFSYNSSIIRGDSLVSGVFHGVTVRAMLDKLLGTGYAYVLHGSYLIILRNSNDAGRNLDGQAERSYVLSGYIVDGHTGIGIANATVYTREGFQSTLTDKQGLFRLRLKIRSAVPNVTISKEWYADTSILIDPGFDQGVRIPLSAVMPAELSPVVVSSNNVERSWLGSHFLTYRQKMQALNLAHFFTTSDVQVSLVPWLGNHGRLSGQVTNSYSINLIGGYNAGVNVVEVAGCFNIDKKDVRWVQAAGIVNDVGGKVEGAQMAGAMNFVLGSMRGIQVAGISNVVKGNASGAQIAGTINVCRDTMRGLQLAALENRARYLKGVQIGLINVADTSDGYSIGLLNIIRHGGVRQFSLSATDVTGLSAEYRVGSKSLNNILIAGYNPWNAKKVYSIGYGLGWTHAFSPRWGIYGEVSAEELYNEHWNGFGMIDRLRPVLTCRLWKKIELFAGPCFSFYLAAPGQLSAAQQLGIPEKGIQSLFADRRTNGWVGVCAGINLF